MQRTVTLPVNPGADWTVLAWPDRYVAEVGRYAVDATAWLTAATTEAIISVAVEEAGTLTVAPVEYVTAGSVIVGWTVKVSGGTSGERASIRSRATLANGETLAVEVTLHTRLGA